MGNINGKTLTFGYESNYNHFLTKNPLQISLLPIVRDPQDRLRVYQVLGKPSSELPKGSESYWKNLFFYRAKTLCENMAL